MDIKDFLEILIKIFGVLAGIWTAGKVLVHFGRWWNSQENEGKATAKQTEENARQIRAIWARLEEHERLADDRLDNVEREFEYLRGILNAPRRSPLNRDFEQ